MYQSLTLKIQLSIYTILAFLACVSCTAPSEGFTLLGIVSIEVTSGQTIEVGSTSLVVQDIPENFSFESVQYELLDYLSVTPQSSVVMGKDKSYYAVLRSYQRTMSEETQEVVTMDFYNAQRFPNQVFSMETMNSIKSEQPNDHWWVEYNMDAQKFQGFRILD